VSGYTFRMRSRPPRNPFYVVLGLVGFAFTITAVSCCMAVLRGVRPETATQARMPFDTLLDKHGTTLLVGELIVLAIATVGAVAVDHVAGTRDRAARDAATPPGTGEP